MIFVTPALNALVGAVVGGLFTAVVHLVRQARAKDNAIEQAVKALTHDSFFRYCRYLLREGYVTTETLENLEHLYASYKALDMNGTGDKLMSECRKLPIKAGE